MEWFLGDKGKSASSGRANQGTSKEKSQVTAGALVGTAPRPSSVISVGSSGLVGSGGRSGGLLSHGRTVATPPANRLTSRRSSRDFSRSAAASSLDFRGGLVSTKATVGFDIGASIPVVDNVQVNVQRKRKRDRLDLKHMPLRGDLWFSR